MLPRCLRRLDWRKPCSPCYRWVMNSWEMQKIDCVLVRLSQNLTWYCTIFLSYIDKALEDEFIYILKKCNIFEEHDESVISSQKKPSGQAEESCHSSILDSTHFCRSSIALDDMQTSTANSVNPASIMRSSADCNYHSSIIFRGWKGRRRSKLISLPRNTDDFKNPLLNPNAIHDRQSMNMLDIKEEREDCRDDVPEEKGRFFDGEHSCLDKVIDFESIAMESSLCKVTLAAPMIRALGPSFTKRRRKVRFQKLHTVTIGAKAGISPSNGRPPMSPASSRKRYETVIRHTE